LDIKLYDRVNKHWVQITVDDFFPVNDHGAPLYARSTGECGVWNLYLVTWSL
jgi:hypothetical protein